MPSRPSSWWRGSWLWQSRFVAWFMDRAVEMLTAELVPVLPPMPQCLVTGNVAGSDTWVDGHPCPCPVCVELFWERP